MRWNPKKVKAKLLRRQGLSLKEIAEELDVSVRTVESWKLGAATGPGEPWTILDLDKEDVGLVLDVLAHVVQITHGLRFLSPREAELAIKIRRARPSLPVSTVWYLGLVYTMREEANEDVEDLDTYLAFAPAWDPPDTDTKRAARAEFHRLKQSLWPDRWFVLPEEMEGIRIIRDQILDIVPADEHGIKPIVSRHGGEGHRVVELIYPDGARRRFEGATEAEAIKKLREAMKEVSNERD